MLVFEGVFLLRPELIDRWDLSIFVSAAFETMVDRPGRETWRRTEPSPRSSAASANATYPPSSSISAWPAPTDHADIIVHNDKPHEPAWEARNP